MNTIKVSDNDIKVMVSVFVYLDTEHPDGDMYVAYCPSLNLVGYGNGEEAAKKDFEWVMGDYFGDMLSQGTLEKDLLKLGWASSRRLFSEPMVSDMMTSNKQLRDVIDGGNYRNVNIGKTCHACV
jgi:hypothetical protein